MKLCPKCQVELSPAVYEGFRVLHCAECKGYLVPWDRLEAIERVPSSTQEELKEEGRREFAGDTTAPLRCPRCRAPMTKERLDVPVLDLHLDRCESCRVAWLDGGELALVQLACEARAKSIEAADLRQRLRELNASPERKAQFEANLARLPDTPDPFSAAVGEGAKMLLWALLDATKPRSRSF
jgi:Zn-finger nucleic acid-binding protein